METIFTTRTESGRLGSIDDDSIEKEISVAKKKGKTNFPEMGTK